MVLNNDFEKYCFLSQKRLILENIKIILHKFANYMYIYKYDFYISDGITMHCNYSDFQIEQHSHFDFYWYNQSS